MARELLLYCDESDVKGRYFSNFYGGALVRSSDLSLIITTLTEKKLDLNLRGEVKWQKVTTNYLDKYIDLIDCFFNFVSDDKVKIRIMFCQTCFIANGLNAYHLENEYFLLYYQFIKYAFGLQYANRNNSDKLKIRTYFDKLPDTKEKCESFKDFIFGLNRHKQFRDSNIFIERAHISEVDSHKHDILQCLDIVLGAITFRLNNKHKAIPEGSKRRGNRTIAKEKLYKHILKRIHQIYPNFNIGNTTSVLGDKSNRWDHPYRHWKFIPNNSTYDKSRTK
ncbi:hypothetical protein SAMN05216302_101159 [Nitrosomonas aestuarii]|uniref:DUF3800 domain-containing protein n=1 Tax=Nitrosomonas aestuarii TaxID=52441 RepID=A0A1I4B642_9PROT|nr:DUF3800 domain-containing protein [Nitrosomonas aestuarii]SFK64382.1 hypothetical protein SAMN05216302_101159 [Nitrosomonas aestuarii]